MWTKRNLRFDRKPFLTRTLSMRTWGKRRDTLQIRWSKEEIGPECFQMVTKRLLTSCSLLATSNFVQSSRNLSRFPSIMLSFAMLPILRKQALKKKGKSRTAKPETEAWVEYIILQSCVFNMLLICILSISFWTQGSTLWKGYFKCLFFCYQSAYHFWCNSSLFLKW